MNFTNHFRTIFFLDSHWKFARSEYEDAAFPSFDDSGWEDIDIPHDWAIRGPFDRNHDIQHSMIIDDGEKKSSEHTGRTGGLPHVGVGWYRKRFTLPQSEAGKRIFAEFDGVMSHSTVFLNGKPVGSWPYGYASFCFELTEYMRFDTENVLAVRVENKPYASRWYPGAGIYRHVRLVIVEPVHVSHWGTSITTSEISDADAVVTIRTTVRNQSGQAEEVELTTTILDPAGHEVASSSAQHNIGDAHEFEQLLRITPPQRWDIDDPKLYKAVSEVNVNGRTVDRDETLFGIREIRFDPNTGFFLNGRNLKFKGVCMHHDLGALGTAVNYRAIERQLEILQEMGCNAIRTSHNPPAPELLNLCDAMGFLVIDEAFDEWKLGKVDNGYHLLFDEWAEKDLRAMITRDRNHPCVMMWSIGNEVGEQRSETGAEAAKFLTEIAHDEDPTRPVTAGFNHSDPAIENGLAAAVDIPGWNYKPFKYAQYHADHPEWIMYGSETESCVSTRGEYYFPVEEERENWRDTLQISSYDLAAPPWGCPPDYELKAQEECPFIMGEFVWTGFDYLGEPTPYKQEWPSRSSYFGIIDLCGFPKDRYYLYQSQWSEKEVLHLLPHWNWEGREGDITPVHCYTNYEAAELFLNGKSLGIRRKNPDGLFDRYRLIWEDVRYESGSLKVVAYDQHKQIAAEQEVKTAGSPAQILLLPDRMTIRNDGCDLSFITVKIVDAEGNLCPLADNLIQFRLNGPGKIVAVDNGDPTSLEPFIADYRRAFHGLCLLIARAVEGTSGEIRISASSENVQGSETVIVC